MLAGTVVRRPHDLVGHEIFKTRGKKFLLDSLTHFNNTHGTIPWQPPFARVPQCTINNVRCKSRISTSCVPHSPPSGATTERGKKHFFLNLYSETKPWTANRTLKGKRSYLCFTGTQGSSVVVFWGCSDLVSRSGENLRKESPLRKKDFLKFKNEEKSPSGSIFYFFELWFKPF